MFMRVRSGTFLEDFLTTTIPSPLTRFAGTASIYDPAVPKGKSDSATLSKKSGSRWLVFR